MNKIKHDSLITIKNENGEFVTGYLVDKDEYEKLARLHRNIQQAINDNKEFLEFESTKKNERQRLLIENKIRFLECFYEY